MKEYSDYLIEKYKLTNAVNPRSGEFIRLFF